MALTSATNAATIVQSQGFLFGEAAATVTVNPGTTNTATNQETISFGSIARFDTSLGTLNAVTFDIGWEGEVEHSFQQSASFTTHTVAHLSRVTFRADGSAADISASASNVGDFGPLFGTIGGFTARDIAGGGTFTETDAGILALFSGPGSIVSSIDLENFVELTVRSGGTVVAGARGCPITGTIDCGVLSGLFDPRIQGTLQVTYDYSASSVAMSAPGGMALLALGLVGLGAVRRRVR